MAQQQVGFVAPKPIERTTGAREGGGKWGKTIGAVAGGVLGGMAAAAGSGGAGTAMGAVGGSLAGAHFGETLGNMIKPPKEGTTAIDRRIAASGPQIQHSGQSEQLKQSLLAMQQMPPAIQQEYKPTLLNAYVASVARDNPRGGGMA